MRFKTFAIFTVLFITIVFCVQSSAYVLTPEPQESLFSGKAVAIDPAKTIASSNLNDHDPRILGSLKKIFPELTVSDKPAAPQDGGAFIYIADKSDEFTAGHCPSMACESLDISKFGAQEYFLGIKKVDNYVLVLILFNRKELENGVGDSYGAYYATKSLKQLLSGNELQEIGIHDWPDFPVRGLLEGFYGKPWPRDGRLEMVNWMSDYKLNMFLYTPKDDHKLRFGWRLRLNEKELSRVKYINDLSNENYIRYCWSLSPGVSINFSSKKDIKTAYQKIKSVLKVGVKCFSLAFDDVGPTLTPYDRDNYDTYWEGQVEFTNKVLGKLMDEFPDVMFAFVANDYWGNLAPESEYLRYVGEHLDQRLSIGWTGDEIAPERIIADDAVFYSYFIKRKPFLGDNFPVLDNINVAGGRLALGPLRGRDPRLYRYVKGFAGNAMPLPLSSKPAYITMADFVWNPMAYDADKSWTNAMKALAGEDKYEPLLFFAKQSESSLIWKYDAMDLNEETRAVIRAFQNLPNYKMAERAKPLRKTFKRFQGIDKELDGLRNDSINSMLDEMRAWIEKLVMYGNVGMKALDLLEAKHSGKKVAAEETDALEKEWQEGEKNLAVITKMVMNNFMKQSIALLRDEPLPKKEKLKSILGE